MYTRLSRANNNVNLYMACRLCYNTLKISQERNMSNQSAASKKVWPAAVPAQSQNTSMSSSTSAGMSFSAKASSASTDVKRIPFEFHIPRWDELPGIDLYMDQVIALIHSSLGKFFALIGLPPLTKGMINNYVKARIIDAPVNKKYGRLSLAMIVIVYILKSCYSTEEIRKLIDIGLRLPDNKVTYNRFCEAVENAVYAVFSGSIHVKDTHEKGREYKYLVDTFALSFACKLYVQYTLNK